MPPKMLFDSDMWHPNVYNTGEKKGEVCVSILVRCVVGGIFADSQHKPGDDEWGYEDAGERWLPVHTVESVVSWTIMK